MGLAAPAGRGRPGRQRLHAGCATSSRRVGWGVRGHVAQWRPQTRGLLGCGGLELRPFPTHTCFRRLNLKRFCVLMHYLLQSCTYFLPLSLGCIGCPFGELHLGTTWARRESRRRWCLGGAVEHAAAYFIADSDRAAHCDGRDPHGVERAGSPPGATTSRPVECLGQRRPPAGRPTPRQFQAGCRRPGRRSPSGTAVAGPPWQTRRPPPSGVTPPSIRPALAAGSGRPTYSPQSQRNLAVRQEHCAVVAPTFKRREQKALTTGASLPEFIHDPQHTVYA